MCVSKDKKLCGCFSIEFGVIIVACLQVFNFLFSLLLEFWVHAGTSFGACLLLVCIPKLGESLLYRSILTWVYVAAILGIIAVIIIKPILMLKVNDIPKIECESNLDPDTGEIIIDEITYDDMQECLESEKYGIIWSFAFFGLLALPMKGFQLHVLYHYRSIHPDLRDDRSL